MKKCPFCGESIQDVAVKCRYCGEFLQRTTTPTLPIPGRQNSSALKIVGVVSCVLGLVAAFFFFAVFDTSVEIPTTEVAGQTVGGGRVNNLGLMNQRQNGIMISCAVSIIGLILFLVGRVAPRQSMSSFEGKVKRVTGGLVCPNCSLINPDTAQSCDCGFRFDR